MEDFVEQLGLPFLPHILRRLSDEMVAGAELWSAAIGIAPTRTVSTLLLLSVRGPQSVTEIAAELRQSHQLVMTWIRQLSSRGLIHSNKDPRDARRTLISLSEEGGAQVRRLQQILAAEEHAFQVLMQEADAAVFEALWRLEKALRRKPYSERLREQLSEDVRLAAKSQRS